MLAWLEMSCRFFASVQSREASRPLDAPSPLEACFSHVLPKMPNRLPSHPVPGVPDPAPRHRYARTSLAVVDRHGCIRPPPIPCSPFHLPAFHVHILYRLGVTASSSAFNTSSLSPDNQGKFYTSSSSASRSTSAELGSLSAAEGFPSPRGADARAGAAGDGGQVSVGVKRGVRIGENKIDREHEDDIESLKPKLPWKRRRL